MPIYACLVVAITGRGLLGNGQSRRVPLDPRPQIRFGRHRPANKWDEPQHPGPRWNPGGHHA